MAMADHHTAMMAPGKLPVLNTVLGAFRDVATHRRCAEVWFQLDEWAQSVAHSSAILERLPKVWDRHALLLWQRPLERWLLGRTAPAIAPPFARLASVRAGG